MAEADAEDRHLADERGDVVARVRRRRRDRRGRWRGRRRRASRASTSVAGVVAGTTRTRQPALDEVAEDVVLDAVVVGDDERAVGGRLGRADARSLEAPERLVPVVRLGARHLADEVAPYEARARLGARHQAIRIEIDRSRSRPPGRRASRRWRTSARVSMPSMPTMPWSRDVVAEALLGAPVARRDPSTRLHDEAARRTARRDSTSSRFTPTLPISGYVIATSCSCVGRVGEDLLVAGHARC